MTVEHDDKEYQFAISLSVLNHLGRNLYRNFVTVLGEAISNSWDADAKNVWIDIDREQNRFIISDDGEGMTPDDFENRFLKIGYSKRKEGGNETQSGRPFIGAKGIGKLALLSCADRISIFTHIEGQPYTGGLIDNSDLDAAIRDDLVPDDYPLEKLNFDLIDGLFNKHEEGTIIVFEGADRVLRNSEDYIRKVLALSFQFALIDPEFTIHVNDEPITHEDLEALSNSTQFLWNINGFDGDFLETFKNLAKDPVALKSELPIDGFIGSVQLPRNLKIHGLDERVTIDLFVNGRIREKNLTKHIPTQRIVESYIYGQIHFSSLDRDGSDPFTSSREGVVESDEEFQKLLAYMKRDLLPHVFDDWDKFRLEIGKDGDDENKRKSKKERKAASFVEAAEDEYRGKETEDGAAKTDEDDQLPDKVDEWLQSLRPDAEFNVSAYMDCFLSENLLRQYIRDKSPEIVKGVKEEIDEWRKNELKNKEAGNVSFEIHRDDDDLEYLGMDALAVTAEGPDAKSKNQSLWKDALSYKPVRNAVGHTGVLSPNAKTHLSMTFENIKGRVRSILKSVV